MRKNKYATLQFWFQFLCNFCLYFDCFEIRIRIDKNVAFKAFFSIDFFFVFHLHPTWQIWAMTLWSNYIIKYIFFCFSLRFHLQVMAKRLSVNSDGSLEVFHFGETVAKEESDDLGGCVLTWQWCERHR